MNSSITTAERIESLKAGGLGAIALGLGFATFALFHLLWKHSPLAASGVIPEYGTGRAGFVSGAIALLSGFLFGVTYRYIVRRDSNSYLKSGAIGAFGLIRGLSQADTGVLLHGNPWLLLLLVGESMVMMAIAQAIVDLGIQRQWIRSFGTHPLGETETSEG